MSPTSDDYEDVLLTQVRGSFSRLAVPDGVRRQALDAFAWASVARTVAEISFDSLLDGDDDLARVRSGQASERRLRFEAPGATLDISVVDNGRRIVGSVAPAMGGTVELRHPTTAPTTAELDAAGTFYAERVPRGSLSVRVIPTGDAEGFVTEWITI